MQIVVNENYSKKSFFECFLYFRFTAMKEAFPNNSKIQKIAAEVSIVVTAIIGEFSKFIQ
jgi:hypothetical protein